MVPYSYTFHIFDGVGGDVMLFSHFSITIPSYLTVLQMVQYRAQAANLKK
jgi:hypothetical protein